MTTIPSQPDGFYTYIYIYTGLVDNHDKREIIVTAVFDSEEREFLQNARPQQPIGNNNAARIGKPTAAA